MTDSVYEKFKQAADATPKPVGTHLYTVGRKLPWRNGTTVEVVAVHPLDSPYIPVEGQAFYTVLHQGRERVTVSQSALIRQGRAV
jgi:hypothetical protein